MALKNTQDKIVPNGWKEEGRIMRPHCPGLPAELICIKRGKKIKWRCSRCKEYVDKPR